MKRINEFGYRLIRPILWVLIFLFMRPRIYHKENIPKKGGCLLVGNHASYFDGIMIGYSTRRPIHFLAKKELFDSKFFGPIVRFIGLISVDRKKKNPEAKEMALNYLEHEKVVAIYPEGTINKTKDIIMPFKYGAVSIAYKSKKPIVPFAIVNKPKIFSYKTKILFGKPYFVKSDDLEKENKILENKVIKLIQEGSENEKSKRT